jgi:hypothetical protein
MQQGKQHEASSTRQTARGMQHAQCAKWHAARGKR